MNEEKKVKEVIETVVNQPVVDIVNLVTKFSIDNDNNRINSWSTENLIGKVNQKCSEILIGVKKETDRLKNEIVELKGQIVELKKNSTNSVGAIGKHEEGSLKDQKISKDTMKEVIDLKESKSKKKDFKG